MKRERTIVLLLLLASRLAGQDLSEKNFVRYTTAEGMSHNTVTAVKQDSIGYIWIGTSSGLNRFNGTRFVQFHTSDDSMSLAAEELAGMTWLDGHRLAIFTSGLHIVDTRTNTSRNIFIPYHDKRYQWKFNVVMTAKGDSEGNIFVVTRSGFYHYDKNYRLRFRFDYYKDSEVPYSHFFFGNIYGGDLYDFDKERLLIIGAGGIYLYHKKNREFRKMTVADCPIMAEFLNYPHAFYSFYQPKPGCFFILKSEHDTMVYVDLLNNRKVSSKLPFARLADEFHYRTKLIAVNDTMLYITGHFSGFYKMRFFRATGSIKFYPEKYFPSYLCYDILKDKENHIWIATNKGLFHEDRPRTQVEITTIPASISDSIPNIWVNDINIMGQTVYVSTHGIAGLLLFDKKKFQFNKLLTYPNREPASAFVNCLVPFDNSSLLLGTGGPMYRFNTVSNRFTKIVPEQWMAGDWTTNFYKTSTGNIWMSCEQVYCYDARVGRFVVQPEETHSRILRTNSFAEDAAGNMWLAGQGLCRYNPGLRKIDLLLDSFPYVKVPQISIGSMLIDKQNNIWFGTYNNGLTCYNIDKGNFRHFTLDDGLPANSITTMIIIGNQLWMAGNSSVACMDLRTLKIIRFGKEDGFPNLPIVSGAKFFYDSSAQQLYLGFSNVIARFNPFEMLRKKLPPRLFIENVTLNSVKNNFLPGDRVTASWRDNEAMITIGSIDFSDANDQGFAYRIVDDNPVAPWQQLGGQSSFSMSNLSPGTHRVQVKVFSVNNRWPEQIKEMSLVVLPPFWKTDWFVIFVSIVAMVLMYFLIRWRTSVVRKKEMEKTHI
ncbi:MAG TPA: two-component regulator propeller domain-containing protein, partial [Chitinophagaceae bacterium]|nr:two-component regulator propeller domain-containing protein [Chitinophagaceae bacterium]